MSRRVLLISLLGAAVLCCAPAVFIWARTMNYWLWASEDERDYAKSVVVGALADSADAFGERSGYSRKLYSVAYPENCETITVKRPDTWTEDHANSVEAIGIAHEVFAGHQFYHGSELSLLANKLSLGRMAVLQACIEATPFGNICTEQVNAIRWNSTDNDRDLVKSHYYTERDGLVCLTYPKIEFEEVDRP